MGNEGNNNKIMLEFCCYVQKMAVSSLLVKASRKMSYLGSAIANMYVSLKACQ